MNQKKILFIDRDGTLLTEPHDQQVDSIEKLGFFPGVITALLQLQAAGYQLVMVTNQDGLGTEGFSQADFDVPHQLMLRIFSSQGIHFSDVLICPHTPEDNCDCRKPKIGLLMDYLTEQRIDLQHSWVIGDRQTDLELAENLKIRGIRFGQPEALNWAEVTKQILAQSRTAKTARKTKETDIQVAVDLDIADKIAVASGIGFFDHMLEQLAKHGGFSLSLQAQGDLHIDEHHTVEDVGIVLGETLRQALGDKCGIARYGFLLPMDEALAQVALDLSGRHYFVFNGVFPREQVGGLATELVPHFFRSLSEGLKATLHIDIKGDNAHHMVEGIFKAVGRSLRQAFTKVGDSLPSTKGIL